MMRWAKAVGDWALAHRWEFRAIVCIPMAWSTYSLITNGLWDYWLTWVGGTIHLLCFWLIGWMWWRQDTLDEFAERTRAAIGSDANLMILTARLQLRTSSMWKLNRVMRRYDIMNVPVLDLPPEAKELRQILESQRTK